MKTTHRLEYLAAALMLVGIIHVSADAQGPAAQSSDWQEEYAYTLGLQAY